jgi:PleD family two-component response regulator
LSTGSYNNNTGSASRLRLTEEKTIRVIESVRDLTSMKDAEARMRDLAGTDALTGLPNCRTFDDVLQQGIAARDQDRGAHIATLDRPRSFPAI